MTLTQILVFSLSALIIGNLVPARWRGWLLLGGSVLALYWLQPSTPIRNLDFWFPSMSIALTVFVWAVTQKHVRGQKETLTILAGLLMFGLIVLLGITRYIGPLCCITPTRPPSIFPILVFLGLVSAAGVVLYRLMPDKRTLSYAAIVVILGLFIILKSEPAALRVSAWLRMSAGQPADQALVSDLPWLGFSYLAFRLLHVLRDYQSDRLPAYSLGDFVTYAVFFPTITAGPIDRSQRFIGDLRKSIDQGAESSSAARILSRLNPDQLTDGGQRILWGVFKKFVLADSLAMIALNSRNAVQVEGALWTWVLLYAYALRLYFDFSGYTDIALGLGRLMGFRLPENFDRPYLKSSLTAFWNSWHITLAQWFRAYYFNPLTRYLRGSGRKIPGWVIIFLGQVSTMLLIGLWHGISWNFAVWGLWHGVGLFINNRWSSWVGPRLRVAEESRWGTRLLKFGGWLLTFNFVAIGWVWFIMPELELSLSVLANLFGF